MSYEKQTWAKGDVVTSAKLNHMEDGIAGSVLTVGVTREESLSTLDKTWQEIYDAPYAVIVEVLEDDGKVSKITTPIITAGADGSTYGVLDGNEVLYTTDSADGYPVNDDK